MAELFPKNGDKEYQEISRDANDTVKEKGTLESNEFS